MGIRKPFRVVVTNANLNKFAFKSKCESNFGVWEQRFGKESDAELGDLLAGVMTVVM